MASRYFATVRRATGTPAALRLSASLASDSGLRGFSASMRRRIIDWMAVLEVSPPPSLLTPEAKKLRSGMVPRGVRAYLREIARDTVEEKIVALQDRKRELAESIVRADESVIGSLTAEDVELLFS